MAEEIIAVGIAPTPAEIEAARLVIESAGLRVTGHDPAPELVVAVEPAPVPEPKNPCMAFRAWEKAQCAALSTFWSTIGAAQCFSRFIKGVRTLAFFAVTGAGALFSSIEGIDLSGVASKLTGLDIQYSDLLLGVSVVGFGLRLITNTSVYKKWGKAARGDGEAPGTGSGDVDEPEADAE